MKRTVWVPLAAAACLILSASVARSACPPSVSGMPWWTWYCEAIDGCAGCTFEYQITVVFPPGQNQGQIGVGYTKHLNYPQGWNTRCFRIIIEEDEECDFTIHTSYDHPWGGAQFDVYFNGRRIGRTSSSVGLWGAPNAGPGIGAPIGDFTEHLCVGEHTLEFREVTTGQKTMDELCTASMNGIDLGVAFSYVRSTGARVPGASGSPAGGPMVEPSAWNGRIALLAPNPSANDTWIHLRPVDRDAKDFALEIFDVRGARLWALEDRFDYATPFRVKWDGRTTAGSRVPPGVYFLRGRVGGARFTERIVRMIGDPASPASISSVPLANALPRPAVPVEEPRPNPRLPVLLNPQNELPPDDEGGGGPPPDLVDHLNAIEPYVRMRPDSTVWIDTVAARASGNVSETSIFIGNTFAWFHSEFALAMKEGPPSSTVGTLEESYGNSIQIPMYWWIGKWVLNKLKGPAARALIPVIEDFVASLPGGDPCGSFRSPNPCGTVACGLSSPVPKEAVIDILESQGFKIGRAH